MKLAYIASPFLMLSTLPQISYADVEAIKEVAKINLLPISLEANAIPVVGVSSYHTEKLQTTANSNKNMTDFLIIHPNVQFNRDWRSAAEQGNLDPSEVSINGHLPYESQFLINGISLNNQLNPSNQSSSNTHSELMGQSQNIALNTDLICALTVLDSNISAAYGDFLGGVVRADTCRPQTAVGEMHGHISYDYTSDHWTKQNYISPEEEALFNRSASETLQPLFTKQGLSTAVYGNLTDHFGINLTASERWADIPLQSLSKQLQPFTQTRNNSNLVIEGFYTPTPLSEIKIGAYLMENAGRYHQASIRNSESEHEAQSQAFSIQTKSQHDFLSLHQNINFQKNSNQREAADHTYSWLSSASKNWMSHNRLSVEGGFGSIKQAENRFEYDLQAQLTPWNWGEVDHRLAFGFGYGHYDAFWQRLAASHWYTFNGNLAGQSCINQAGIRDPACDEAATNQPKFKGQYSQSRTTYDAGQIDISQNRWHIFLEDTINYRDSVSLRLGLRGDYDSLTHDYDFAPRMTMQYYPLETKALAVTTGWNRYYGRNAFQNELQDQKRLLQYLETRTDLNAPWTEVEGSRYGRMAVRNQLDTPYSDESVIAFNGQQEQWAWQLKWVNRHAQKQIRRSADKLVEKPDGSGYFNIYQYDNSGHSKANIYTLSVNNITPLWFKDTYHHFDFAADWSKVNRSFSSYDDAFTDPDELIFYDGELIRAIDRPATHFNTPWTLRLQWLTQWQHLPMTLNHTFHFRSPSDYYSIESDSNTSSQTLPHKSYEVRKVPSAFYWDLKATYTTQLSQKLSATWGLTINNVLNKHNRYIDEAGDDRSEIGRQFIADLKFKF